MTLAAGTSNAVDMREASWRVNGCGATFVRAADSGSLCFGSGGSCELQLPSPPMPPPGSEPCMDTPDWLVAEYALDQGVPGISSCTDVVASGLCPTSLARTGCALSCGTCSDEYTSILALRRSTSRHLKGCNSCACRGNCGCSGGVGHGGRQSQSQSRTRYKNSAPSGATCTASDNDQSQTRSRSRTCSNGGFGGWGTWYIFFVLFFIPNACGLSNQREHC